MDFNEIDVDDFAFNESESMEEEYDGDTQVENTSGDTSKGKTSVQSKPSRKRKETFEDPRYKMTFVEFAYKKVYGIDSSELEIVRNKLISSFDECTLTSMSTRGSRLASLPSSSGGGDIITDTGSDNFTTNIMHTNMICYPDLSVMACDILSIPVSTVASESAFSISGRVFNRFRSLLKPDMVEAIVCTRDWMQGEYVNETIEVDKIAEDILKLTLENSPGPSVESATSQFGD
ncbi:hypothetical protein LWI28_018450 [Acer negundo]|uniref:HAT C-terminal dimerisation domain-containing protein n=1 Tax=Acer negundo TaxID=4023 RepID=A0AAD5IWE2_ACENE|nr:hypothetical protein LWI28_018450 [Acer negundo]